MSKPAFCAKIEKVSGPWRSPRAAPETKGTDCMNVAFSARIQALQPSAIREILKVTQDPSVISFAAGNPAAESFPVKEMAQIASGLFNEKATSALQYSVIEGYTPLREKVRARLRERFDAVHDGDDVIIVSGGQQGIELSCKVLCDEGDTVLCENPSFIGALNAFRSYNVRLHGIPLEEDGIDIDALAHALATLPRVKLLYLIPTFQNPSGITMSLSKRRAVYELCLRRGVMILEDNPYGELRFSGDDVPVIKSLDTEGIVIYCGSFSKILSPGIRLGFVSAPKAVVQKLVVAKQVSDVHTNIFFQMLADEYLARFDLDAHIARIRAMYREKFLAMHGTAARYFPKAAGLTRPDGGIFLWCTLPEGTDILELCRLCAQKKVAIVPGTSFMVDENTPCSAFRLNFSTPTLEQIENGMATLGGVLRDFLG